jgi:CRP-like cAMP-binding protein
MHNAQCRLQNAQCGLHTEAAAPSLVNMPTTSKRAAAFAPPLLAGLSEAEARLVLARAAVRAIPARTVLCRQGDAAASLFVVEAGRVRFSRGTPEGHDVLLRWLVAGECFGLASLVPGTLHYMGTAATETEARIHVWPAETIRDAAAAIPRLSENALRIALKYLEEFSDRHVALVSRSAEQRLARTLTHLAATVGRVLPSGVEIDITNHDLAALADVGVFTASRQLQRWERQGHLVKKRQRVLIRHPEGLL